MCLILIAFYKSIYVDKCSINEIPSVDSALSVLNFFPLSEYDILSEAGRNCGNATLRLPPYLLRSSSYVSLSKIGLKFTLKETVRLG